MADFNISGRMKIKSLKESFNKEFGLSLRVYKGNKFADDNDTVASVAGKSIPNGAEVKANGRTHVGNFEDSVKETFSIKIQIATKDDSKLVDNGISLSAASKA